MQSEVADFAPVPPPGELDLNISLRLNTTVRLNGNWICVWLLFVYSFTIIHVCFLAMAAGQSTAVWRNLVFSASLSFFADKGIFSSCEFELWPKISTDERDLLDGIKLNHHARNISQRFESYRPHIQTRYLINSSHVQLVVPKITRQADQSNEFQNRRCYDVVTSGIKTILYLGLVCALLSTHAVADRQGVDISFTVCLFVCLFVCLYVRLRISPATKYKASSVKICTVVQERPEQESPILGNFASRSPKSNESARGGKYCP